MTPSSLSAPRAVLLELGGPGLEEAIEYQTRFVELWEDADPELQPRVEEARRR